MEDLDKNNALGLPLYPKNPPNVAKHFTILSPSNLPLPTASHQVWNKPYLPYLDAFDGESSPPPPDDLIMKTEIPSPPSDNNQSNGVAVEPATTNGAISVKTKPAAIHLEMKWGRSTDPDMNQKKIKRILSNRISAQKSRMKKIQYINDMEKKAKDLQAQIAMLSPRIAYQQHQYKVLRMEKGVLQQKLDDYEDRSKHSYVEMVERQAEVKRLKEYFLMIQQEMQKQEEAMMFGWKPDGQEQTAVLGLYQPVGPQPVIGMNPNQDGLDPFLNFNSLTIDPPKSLM